MSAYMVEISEELEKRFQSEAERRGITIEEYMREVMMTAMPTRGQSFQEAMKATFKKNDEVYRRLAQ